MTATLEAPPKRTVEQRMAALARANETRSKRAKLKLHLRAGTKGIVSLLIDPPPYAEGMAVEDALKALPGWGEVKVEAMLRRLRVPGSKTIGALKGRQQRELVAELLP